MDAFGKKKKKESVMDALMKLGEPTEKNQKEKARFSIQANLPTQPTERKEKGTRSFGKNHVADSMNIENRMEMPTKKARKSELNDHVKNKQHKEGMDLTEKKVATPHTSSPVAFENTVNFIQHKTKNLSSTHEKDEKKEKTVAIQPRLSNFSQPTAKPALSLTDIQQEQQIQILRDIAKQLKQTPSTKEETFPLPETTGKSKITQIQLALQDTVARKEHALTTSPLQLSPKEPKKLKEIESVKTEITFAEGKTETKWSENIRTEVGKGEGARELRSLVTQGIEQYVEFKEINSKKVSLMIAHDELGRMDIQIEKKDDKIHISLTVENDVRQEEVEQVFETIKQELKDKEIDVEYEVNKEGDQKEKRKEEQAMTEKEHKREKQNEKEKNIINFDELLEVEL